MTTHADSWPYIAWFTETFRDLVDVGLLTTMSVGIIGLRCMGDLAANQLTRLGVGAMTLADSESVDVPALGVLRTLRDLGKAKLTVVGNDLLAINPHLRLTRVSGDISRCSDDELRHLAGSVDALVCMTNEPSINARINAVVYKEVPTIYSTMESRRALGRVVWTLPKRTACWMCCTQAQAPHSPSRREPGQVLPLDTLFVVGMTVQVVLGILLRQGRDWELSRGLLDTKRNLILVATRRDNWLCERLPEEFLSAAVTVDTTAPRGQCPICGT